MILSLCAPLAWNLYISLFLGPPPKHELNLSQINDSELLDASDFESLNSMFLAPLETLSTPVSNQYSKPLDPSGPESIDFLVSGPSQKHLLNQSQINDSEPLGPESLDFRVSGPLQKH